MFDKILIANRGEIAARVIKTARRLGIRTVAVYSEADARALHVEMADEAVCIGPAPAAQSYLRSDTIIEVAKSTGAQAVHPGYGFLSENEGFAASCAAAGIAFIGPPIEAIRVMGSKAESKRLMSGAGVPLVPGYHGDAQDFDTLAREAEAIGYPVLVKASAGGGGKGMRIVRHATELQEAVVGAKRESKAAFADDRLLLEKYLENPRHVEIQVFGDTHGNCLYLFERDCSIQRRHQKVIEEAPAPGLKEETRKAMGEAAVAAARAVNYVGAGTVEFLYAGGRFYFIEMNTRLQVEHPVTEMITGLDLVEWQLRVASGEALPLRQEQLSKRGHAFEARVYAEDPEREFMPSIGKLLHVKPPIESSHVRIDTGVRTGDQISVYYDPMIAKLIVWDESRAAALRRLQRALTEYEVAGVTTNIPFLAAIAGQPDFASAAVDTGFIERHRDVLMTPAAVVPDECIALGALAIVKQTQAQTRATPSQTDPYSPWSQLTGWRMNGDSYIEVRLTTGGNTQSIVLHSRVDGYDIDLPSGRTLHAMQPGYQHGNISTILDGKKIQAAALFHGDDVLIVRGGRTWRFQQTESHGGADKVDSGAERAIAPMPGVVVAVNVQEGQVVERGQVLIVLEAMKMEHSIKASAAGRVTGLHFSVGQQVTEGMELLTIEISQS